MSISRSGGQNELKRPVVSSTITSLVIRSRLVYQFLIYKQIQLQTSKWLLECILYMRVTKHCILGVGVCLSQYVCAVALQVSIQSG